MKVNDHLKPCHVSNSEQGMNHDLRKNDMLKTTEMAKFAACENEEEGNETLSPKKVLLQFKLSFGTLDPEAI